MESEFELTSSDKSVTGSYFEPDEYSAYLHISKDLLTFLYHHGAVYSGEQTWTYTPNIFHLLLFISHLQ
jgi:hypothetical protein